jgi:hypothetical protein
MTSRITDEITMPNCSESLRSGRAPRCAVCDGKFGLVRYYSWRTALCSKKCVDRFRARRTSDSSWLRWVLDEAMSNKPVSLALRKASVGQMQTPLVAWRHRRIGR